MTKIFNFALKIKGVVGRVAHAKSSMIWRFQTYNLFCEILKSRRSKTEFRDEIYIFCETNFISRSRASE